MWPLPYVSRLRRWRPPWRHVLVSLAVLGHVTCAPTRAGVPDPFDPTSLPAFRLTELVEVGRDDGGTTPLLNQVTAAVVLASGGIAVASDEGQILVFGPRGAFRRTLGRPGEGPGEFRLIHDLVGLGDNRIVAWDPALDRVTAFTQDGSLDFTCTPPWARSKQAGVGFVGALRDGRFVLEDRSSRPTEPRGSGGLRRDTIPYLLFDHTGTLIRTIAEFVRHPRPYDASTGYRRFLFAASVHARIIGDELYVGESDSIVLQRFDSVGAAHPPLRLERPPRRVTELDVEAGWRAWGEQIAIQYRQMLVQAAVTAGEDVAAEMQRRTDEAIARAKETTAPAEFLPAYKSMVVASDRAIWVEDYLHPTEKATRWFLMGGDFHPVGWIELPPNERLLAAGPDRMVVLRKDDLEVESVVVYGGDWPQVAR